MAAVHMGLPARTTRRTRVAMESRRAVAERAAVMIACSTSATTNAHGKRLPDRRATRRVWVPYVAIGVRLAARRSYAVRGWVQRSVSAAGTTLASVPESTKKRPPEKGALAGRKPFWVLQRK
ncbi:hypothetical protein E2C01_048722 [Portunus trituberculatus]|uniref:Uncharacterized protein n=1 Tax=Portunus trituberculatus TaxID=210409 RepID=A0A5B7GBA6_PORTR|nr:hypothetical protein [Portunus trituberculatus]